VLAALGIGAVFLVWLADTACGTRGMGVIRRHLSGARLAWSVGAGLVLNWIYLLLVRPS
jgi:hypothetical protein